VEDRKSVLETVRPADALGRLSARNSSQRIVFVVAGVLIFFGIVFFGASLFRTTSGGTGNLDLPSVKQK